VMENRAQHGASVFVFWETGATKFPSFARSSCVSARKSETRD
jgi:hypothetical protein